MMMRSSVTAAVVLLIAGGAFAASPEVAAKVRTGNAAYQAGDYAKALEVYDEAEVQCPECPEVAYNRGLTYYRMRDFVKAREMFNTALSTRDLGLEAQAKYNLGNVAYAQALEKLSAPQEAIESARQAIFHYRDALELNPDDSDARANIEIAQLFIKDMLDKLKKEQEEQQKNQQDQNQDQQCDNPGEQDQQSGDQQQSDEQQKDQGQQKQDEQDQPEQGEKDQQQAADQQPADEQQNDQQQNDQQQASDAQDQEQQEAQAARADPRQMSEEEVERALQAVRDREAQRRAERARQQNLRRAPVTKDW